MDALSKAKKDLECARRNMLEFYILEIREAYKKTKEIGEEDTFLNRLEKIVKKINPDRSFYEREAKTVRINAKLTQLELCEELKLTPSYVSTISVF